MEWNRRLVAATVCVEAVAAVSVVVYGYLAVVAVTVLYWIDLFSLTLRSMAQRLLARPTTSTALIQGVLPFRLLKHKRGSVTVSERLPPMYPRDIPDTVGLVFLLTVSALSTVYVLTAYTPEEF